jgi:hypothetical protein
MKFKTPKVELALAYVTLRGLTGIPPRRSYFLFEESVFVLKDFYHVESGRIELQGMRQVSAEHVLGKVKGIHKVDRRTASGTSRWREYQLLEEAYHERYRDDGIDTNFSWFEEWIAIFDDEGIMHTVLELDQVVAASRVA